MALIRCPECNHEISDTAKFCPNCGYVMKNEDSIPVPEETTEEQITQEESPAKKKKAKKKPWAVILVLAAIIVAFFGVNSIVTSLNNSKWTTVEHLGLRFDVPGYYHLENTSDGSIWYESKIPGFHLYYINGYTLGAGNEEWIMSKLNLDWGDLKEGESTEDTTAHGQKIYTQKYSGQMFASDVNGEISILPYADKGTYIFEYLEYAGHTKYEEDYHRILQSITKSPESLPNTQIQMKEITFDGIHIDIPEYFEKDDSKSDKSSVRYSDYFSLITIVSTDMSSVAAYTTEDYFTTYMLDTLNDPANLETFADNIVTVDKVNTYTTDYGIYALGEYSIADNHDGKSWVIAYWNNQTNYGYTVTLYGYSEATGYINKYHDILQSIKFDQPSSDVKAVLDGFESFMNKYVDFMVAVKNGSSSLSALGEYSELLTEYADWMSKIESIDTDQLSVTDAAYFAEVYARVMSKLASAGLSN